MRNNLVAQVKLKNFSVKSVFQDVTKITIGLILESKGVIQVLYNCLLLLNISSDNAFAYVAGQVYINQQAIKEIEVRLFFDIQLQ